MRRHSDAALDPAALPAELVPPDGPAPWALCYESAYRYLTERAEAATRAGIRLRLVHGAVDVPDPPLLYGLGSTFGMYGAGHAWVAIDGEGIGEIVYDPNDRAFYRRDRYMQNHRTIRSWAEADEAARMYRMRGHYGPWHDEPVIHVEEG